MIEIAKKNPKWVVMKTHHEDDDLSHSDYRPTRHHDSFEEAEREAMRLAVNHRGHCFEVLQLQRRVTALVVHVEKFPRNPPKLNQ